MMRHWRRAEAAVNGGRRNWAVVIMAAIIPAAGWIVVATAVDDRWRRDDRLNDRRSSHNWLDHSGGCDDWLNYSARLHIGGHGLNHGTRLYHGAWLYHGGRLDVGRGRLDVGRSWLDVGGSCANFHGPWVEDGGCSADVADDGDDVEDRVQVTMGWAVVMTCLRGGASDAQNSECGDEGIVLFHVDLL